MHLTLLVPELLWPEPTDAHTLAHLSCPALEGFLGRARLTRSPKTALESCLAACLGVHDAPLSVCRLQGEAAPISPAAAGFWHCADPVHLLFHQQRLLMGDTGLHDLTLPEAEALTADLTAHFPELGRFYAPAPQRWYLEATPTARLPPLPPLSAALGRELGSLLPEQRPEFVQTLNALQIQLHAHPINQRREQNGQTPVNGLWFWGGNRPEAAPPAPAPDFSPPRIAWGEATSPFTPLLAGLCQQQGISFQPLPQNGADWLRSLFDTPAPQSQFVLLDDLCPPALLQDGETWKTRLAQLDQTWFLPLVTALGHKISTLNLLSPTAYGLLHWRGATPHRWQFWKRPLALPALIRQLATQE
ncbi:MAG: hypothetical protein LBS89_02175 [Zoogloeaceae bacterium]|jgi:hypothetical protein|nr:hypothetical protein [Zoogloeaceae bacterium]